MSRSANSREEQELRKIFVGGLSPDSTDESLTRFYESWGQVANCSVVRDRNSGRSKCFAFVTFEDLGSVDRCLFHLPHVIDGKQVDARRVEKKTEGATGNISNNNNGNRNNNGNSGNRNNNFNNKEGNKIFIGGLKTLLEQDIVDYFSSFGSVLKVDMVTDRQTGTSRGFCFLSFADSNSVDRALVMRHHTINRVRVEVKTALERNNQGPRVGRNEQVPGYGFPQGPSPSLAPDGFNQYGYYGYDWSQNAGNLWDPYANYGACNYYQLGTGYANEYNGGAVKGDSRHLQRAQGPYDYKPDAPSNQASRDAGRSRASDDRVASGSDAGQPGVDGNGHNSDAGDRDGSDARNYGDHDNSDSGNYGDNNNYDAENHYSHDSVDVGSSDGYNNHDDNEDGLSVANEYSYKDTDYRSLRGGANGDQHDDDAEDKDGGDDDNGQGDNYDDDENNNGDKYDDDAN